jgi:hypothetical protein
MPTNLLWSVSGTNLTLSWPPDHTGWRLQMNTNNLADTNAWFPIPDSANTNQLELPMDATQAEVFFRLIYP